VRHERVVHGAGVYVATREGLGVAGLEELGPGTVSLQSYTHELRCVDQLVALELAGFSETLTEREMRAAERVGDARFSVPLARFAAKGAERVHWPDLAIRREEGWWAVEVELTAKTPGRLEEILRGYRRCQHLAGVLYYLQAQAERDRVMAIAGRLEMGNRLVCARLAEPGTANASGAASVGGAR